MWSHEAGGSRMWLTVAIKQMYGGHAKQAGLIASQCHAGAYANRFVIVVDDDIDPTDTNQVLWALSTRTDVVEDIDVIKRCWSTTLDPTSYPEEERRLNSRVVIDACKPWIKRNSFPRVARSSRELDERVRAKFAKELRGY